MNFLAFNLFKPSTWLSGAADGIMGAILSGLRTLLFEIVTTIYQLIGNVYNLFERLCKARLLSNDILGEMTKRIGFILGLITFFYVIFSLIQMLINPDKVADKEKGAISIIKKVIIVIVLLGASNGAFNSLYKIQAQIIDSNVISKIILPYAIGGDAKGNFGNLLSMQLMMAFYQVDEQLGKETNTDGKDKIDACKNLTDGLYQQIYTDNKYNRGFLCLNESVQITQNVPEAVSDGDTDEVFLINFNGIVAILVGGFTLYLLLIYCFKIGVRMTQLAFLEIISPMAFISYLAPKKDTMLTKWWKIYFSTYIDVFIRIAIINFVVFLICTIFEPTGAGDGNFKFWESLGNPEGLEAGFFTVVIILALLTFAKKAPDLIKEIIGSSASKLGFGAAMKDIVGLEKVGKWAPKAATGILGGALGGAAIGLLGGGIGGFAGGLFKGGLSGLKGQGFTKAASGAWKSQQATNKRVQEWRNAGGTSTFGRWGAAFNQWRGAETAGDVFDLEKTKLEKENAAYKAFDSYIDAAEKRAEGQILKGVFNSNAHASEALKQKNLAEIYRQQSANIKRDDYAIKDKKTGKIVGYNDTGYNTALEKLAKMASDAETKYLNEMKEAKKEYITYTLDVSNGKIAGKNPSDADVVTLQNLQQAAGVIDANKDNDYSGFAKTSSEKLLGENGDYKAFDDVNSKSKGIQAENNNKILENEQKGKAARANAKYSGRK